MELVIYKVERTSPRPAPLLVVLPQDLGIWGQGVCYVICDVLLAYWPGVPVVWEAWMGSSGDRPMGKG